MVAIHPIFQITECEFESLVDHKDQCKVSNDTSLDIRLNYGCICVNTLKMELNQGKHNFFSTVNRKISYCSVYKKRGNH